MPASNAEAKGAGSKGVRTFFVIFQKTKFALKEKN